MKRFPGERRKNALRHLTFVFERFGEHELANHAAAGAYAFLLSATPALLLVLGLSTSLLSAFPEAKAAWLEFTREIFGGLATGGSLKRIQTGSPGLAGTLLVLLSLVWAARLFILTVQRGLRVVWGISPLAKPVRDNVLTFVLEFAALVFVVLVLGAAETFRFFLDYLAPLMGESVDLVTRLFALAVPGLLLFFYAYFTYRFIPPEGPRRKTAAAAALLCVLFYAFFSSILSFAINRTHYDLLYGVFGSLVILLLKVWMFFMVYFHAAEFAYVHERFDSLLFARFLRVAKSEKPGRLAAALFARPEGILRRFGRSFEAGQTLFREGDSGKEAYYLLEGEVGVYLREAEGQGEDRRIASINEGELFGEIADLIQEGRTATTKAETRIEVIILPPELFESLLANDPHTSRRMIDLLSRRLREANVRVAAEGAMYPFDAEGEADSASDSTPTGRGESGDAAPQDEKRKKP
jgi:membrane protein